MVYDKGYPMQAVINIRRQVGAFFSGTALSRLTGFGRDLSMAICFGATPAVAAFMLAFRFANLARRLLGETPLSSSFIPHFETLKKESTAKALKFFVDFMLSLMLVLALLIVPTMWLLPNTEVCHLTRLMLPGLFFICLFGLSNAFLHTEKRFFLSGASPIAFNAIWIIAACLLRGHARAMSYLSIAVVIAFAMQFLTCFLPILRKLSWNLIKSARPFTPAIRAIATPFALGILGASASQINSALDALFARAACPEGPAYLWYAIRMQQLPLALFGIAWSTTLLPAFSRAESAEQQTLLSHAIEKCAFFLVPITFALLPCASAGVNLLFNHGAFTPVATLATTHCLWAYGLGIFPAALVMILSAKLYAEKNFSLPARTAFVCVIINTMLNTLLVYVFHLGPASIAFATSISQIINALILLRHIKPKFNLKKITLMSLIAAIAATLFYPDPIFLNTPFPREIFKQLTNLALPFTAFCIAMALQWRFFKTRLSRSDQ